MDIILAGAKRAPKHFSPTVAQPLAGFGAGRLYYVKVVARGATAVTAKGSPHQALACITDGHDSRREQGYGKHVVLVDVYIAFVSDGSYRSTLMYDRLHPNIAGFQKMADTWNTVINERVN